MGRLNIVPIAGPALKFRPHDTLGRDNNFNFLRLLLASLVILSHAPELVDGNPNREIYNRIFHHGTFGGLAVNGFFLLSGFLILQSWHREPRLASFVHKRVLRIYPGFIVAYLLSGLVVGPLAATTQSYFRDISVFKFIFAMLTLRLPSIPEVFAGAHYPVVNGAMWTISHEFRCYLLVPLLSWLGLVKYRVGWLLFTLAVLGCAVSPLPFPFPFMSGRLWMHLLPVGPWATLPLLAFFCMGGCFLPLPQRVEIQDKLGCRNDGTTGALSFLRTIRPIGSGDGGGLHPVLVCFRAASRVKILSSALGRFLRCVSVRLAHAKLAHMVLSTGFALGARCGGLERLLGIGFSELASGRVAIPAAEASARPPGRGHATCTWVK